MICSKCGAKASEGARFCSACGSSLYGAPILQIVKDAEGNESIEVISGAAGIPETVPEKKEEKVPVLQMSPAPVQEIIVPSAKPKESADKMFADAEALMQFGDFSLASNGFKKMSAAYPEDWRGWFGELRADVMRQLDKSRYDVNYSYASLPEHELMEKALALHQDQQDYVPFFEKILPEWEAKPHMIPLHETVKFGRGMAVYTTGFSEPVLDDRNVGAASAIRDSRPEYRECMVYAKEGVYYNPDSFMCWFVKKDGLGDIIRMIGNEGLSRRADGLLALYIDGYLNGKLVGPNYCACPALDEDAYRIQEEHRGDFNALIRLIRGFGLSAKYYQMAKQLLIQLPGERDERRFTVLGYTVVGRTVEIACENTDGRVYCMSFVYPENSDPARFL